MKNLFSLGLLSLAFSPLAIAVTTGLEKTTQPVVTAVTKSITQTGVPSSEGETVSVLNDEAEKALKSLLANIESLSASFTQQIIDRLKNLKEFTISVPVEDNWLPNGVVPFDIKIKHGIATVKIPALTEDEARTKAISYFNSSDRED